MLAVREIREWLASRAFPVVAVSPIIGGQAVKGPAAKMMRELGLEASAAAVARHYGALVDALGRSMNGMQDSHRRSTRSASTLSWRTR